MHYLVRADVPLLRRRNVFVHQDTAAVRKPKGVQFGLADDVEDAPRLPDHQFAHDLDPVGDLVEQREVGVAVVFEVELQLRDDGVEVERRLRVVKVAEDARDLGADSGPCDLILAGPATISSEAPMFTTPPTSCFAAPETLSRPFPGSAKRWCLLRSRPA